MNKFVRYILSKKTTKDIFIGLSSMEDNYDHSIELNNRKYEYDFYELRNMLFEIFKKQNNNEWTNYGHIGVIGMSLKKFNSNKGILGGTNNYALMLKSDSVDHAMRRVDNFILFVFHQEIATIYAEDILSLTEDDLKQLGFNCFDKFKKNFERTKKIEREILCKRQFIYFDLEEYSPALQLKNCIKRLESNFKIKFENSAEGTFQKFESEFRIRTLITYLITFNKKLGTITVEFQTDLFKNKITLYIAGLVGPKEMYEILSKSLIRIIIFVEVLSHIMTKEGKKLKINKIKHNFENDSFSMDLRIKKNVVELTSTPEILELKSESDNANLTIGIFEQESKKSRLSKVDIFLQDI